MSRGNGGRRGISCVLATLGGAGDDRNVAMAPDMNAVGG